MYAYRLHDCLIRQRSPSSTTRRRPEYRNRPPSLAKCGHSWTWHRESICSHPSPASNPNRRGRALRPASTGWSQHRCHNRVSDWPSCTSMMAPWCCIDVTSSYLESRCCELARFGHIRDGDACASVTAARSRYEECSTATVSDPPTVLTVRRLGGFFRLSLPDEQCRGEKHVWRLCETPSAFCMSAGRRRAATEIPPYPPATDSRKVPKTDASGASVMIRLWHATWSRHRLVHVLAATKTQVRRAFRPWVPKLCRAGGSARRCPTRSVEATSIGHGRDDGRPDRLLVKARSAPHRGRSPARLQATSAWARRFKSLERSELRPRPSRLRVMSLGFTSMAPSVRFRVH